MRAVIVPIEGQLIGTRDNSAPCVSPLQPPSSLAVSASYDALNRPLGFSWSPGARARRDGGHEQLELRLQL